MDTVAKWLKSFAAATLILLGTLPGHANEKLSLLLSWRAQAGFGGYYQALNRGFYSDCGIDVTIRQGGPGIDALQLLASGAVDMTFAQQIDGPLHLIDAGFPVRAVMAAHQRTPQILMTHPGNGINSIEDMRGKPIMISSGSRSTFWPFLRVKYGFSDTQIRTATGSLTLWLNDPMAIQQGLITEEPFLVRQQTGQLPKSFLLADIGYNTYAQMMLAPQALIDQKPQVVSCMVDASRKGWTEFLTEPHPIAFEAIKKDNNYNTDDMMRYTIEAIHEFHIMDSPDTAKYGYGAMDDERWKNHFELLVANGLIRKDLDYRQAYTLQFSNKGLAAAR
jgi:NitT/TauT family transport system substrate-binding protein